MQKIILKLFGFCITSIFLIYHYFQSWDATIYREENNSKRHVLMSVNIDEKKNMFYFFYLPIAAAAWKKLGFNPIVLLVTTNNKYFKKFDNNNPPAMKTVDYLKKFGAKIIFVKSNKNYDLITAMLCRLFVGVLKFLKDDDYIISSDSDLIPISKEYYRIEDINAITAWNAYCCGNFTFKNRIYEMYPMGHVGMKKKHWRAVMGLNSSLTINSQSVADLLSESYGKNFVKRNDQIVRGDEIWNSDQVILSSKIGNYLEVNREVNLIKKPYVGNRVDRSEKDLYLRSLIDYSFNKITDFHAFHHDYLERWTISKRLLKKIFDYKTYQNLNFYYTEFTNSIAC